MPNPNYCIKVTTEFSAAHTLKGYDGACRKMHGHNWKVEVEVIATELDEIDMGIDFKAVRKAAKEVAGELDHCYLNDLPPFTENNPTAENIAAHFYQRLSRQLNGQSVRVEAVTLWETDRACVRYTETR